MQLGQRESEYNLVQAHGHGPGSLEPSMAAQASRLSRLLVCRLIAAHLSSRSMKVVSNPRQRMITKIDLKQHSALCALDLAFFPSNLYM